MKKVILTVLSIIIIFQFSACKKDGSEDLFPEILIESQNIKGGLMSVFFIDANTGWIVGNNDTIYKTKDGGNMWSVSTSGTDKYLASVCFVDEDTGYCVGDAGTILKTVNGGKTWNKINRWDGNLNAVTFINHDKGFIVGDVGALLKTEDGGITWNYMNCGIRNCLTSIDFVDENIGYIVGWAGTIIKTVDSGNTWTLLDGKGIWLESVNFIDQYHGFAAGGELPTGNGVVMKTFDGGITWSTSKLSERGFHSIFFTNKNVGYTVGWDGILLKTIDGGLNWSITNSGTTNHLFSIFFPDNKTGYVVGNNTIIKIAE